MDADKIQEQFDAEWDELDAAAEEEERKVLLEVAAARKERAKIEERKNKREAAAEEKARKESEAEAKRVEAAKADEDLNEGQQLLRKTRRAARDAVRIRKSMRASLALSILGILGMASGLFQSMLLVAGIGAVCFIACIVFYFYARPHYQSAKADYEILYAQLQERKLKYPEEFPEEQPAE